MDKKSLNTFSTYFLIAAAIVALFNISATTATAENEFTLSLNEGWNLLSVPRWAEVIEFTGGDIEAWLTYRGGRWVSVGDEKVMKNELNNPARAVYIKAARQTEIIFKWAEISPEKQFAYQDLSPGWNLIGCGLQADYLTILAAIYDGGTGGVSHIYALNSYNGRKEKGYHLPWQREMNSLADPDPGHLYDMYPLDGYWVYLRGEAVTYSTPAGDEMPGRID